MTHGTSYFKIHKFKRCLEIFPLQRVNTFMHGMPAKYKLTIYSLTFARKCKRYLSFEIVRLYIVIERQIGHTQAMARENKCSTIKICFAVFYFNKVPQDTRPQPERHGCVTDRSYLLIDLITTHYFSLQVACYII